MKIKKILKYCGLGIAIIIGGILVAGQITYHSIAEIDPPPGEMYSVNEGEIHMHCTGPKNEDQPTIIIIAGAGVPSFLYSHLQDKLSETIRTCSYDSAGIGWSQANDIPYNAKNLSDELYQLLQAAQIDGPIILAGHSLGGIVSLIYSAEHEEQIAGIAFIDSSHYNQTDYFGKEFKDMSDKQIDEHLANLWLIELASNLGILSLVSIFATSELEELAEERKMLESFNKWNPPYPTIKSMLSNLNLSFEQGKEVHYARGDLPIISISASDEISGSPTEIGNISAEEYREGFKKLHKDLAELSTNGRYVIVNGTNHISIAHNDETADHVLSLIPNIENNHTLSERTEFDIYQDFIDSQKRIDSAMIEWYDIILHSDDDLANIIRILENEKNIQSNLFDEYTSLLDSEKIDEQIHSKIANIANYGLLSDDSLVDNLKYQKESEQDIRITLEHHGCANTCPVYSVIINGDGTVLYKGLHNVKEIGKQEYEIAADTIAGLDKFLSEVYRGNIKDEYGSPDEAENTVIITIEFGGAKRIVIYDNSGPELLKQFEEKIEEIAMIKELI